MATSIHLPPAPGCASQSVSSCKPIRWHIYSTNWYDMVYSTQKSATLPCRHGNPATPRPPPDRSGRLREYNERTSRILGGRLSVTCDHGVSLMCLVNNPLFDAAAAPRMKQEGWRHQVVRDLGDHVVKQEIITTIIWYEYHIWLVIWVLVPENVRRMPFHLHHFPAQRRGISDPLQLLCRRMGDGMGHIQYADESHHQGDPGHPKGQVEDT